MTLSELCNALYCKPKSKSQGAFMSALFYAAGSSYGSKPPKNIDYLGKIFRGEPLTASVKDSFAKPFREKELVDFMNEYIDDTALPTLFSLFQLPNTVEINKSKFMLALCRQFQLFIADDSENAVDNIVITEYHALLACEMKMVQNTIPPLYSSDSFYISRDVKVEYVVGCYKQIDHKLTIENYSRVVDWMDRYLEFDTTSTDKIEPLTQTIPIPFTRHGGKADILIQVKSKGVEGIYCLKWVIKDKDGRHCFPNRTIDMTITVDFKLNK